MRIMAQNNQIEGYSRALQSGISIESELGEPVYLADVVFEDVMNGRAKSVQDVLDSLGWTLLAHRVRSNPSYYDPLKTDAQDDEEARHVHALSRAARVTMVNFTVITLETFFFCLMARVSLAGGALSYEKEPQKHSTASLRRGGSARMRRTATSCIAARSAQ